MRAFSSCGKQGPLFIVVRGPLTVAASLAAEHRLQTRRLSNCDSRAQSLRGMWDPPRPGLEPVSPALAGRFSTTAPPGKPLYRFYHLNTNPKQYSFFLPVFHFYANGINVGILVNTFFGLGVNIIYMYMYVSVCIYTYMYIHTYIIFWFKFLQHYSF